jgi:hypothetical protein
LTKSFLKRAFYLIQIEYKISVDVLKIKLEEHHKDTTGTKEASAFFQIIPYRNKTLQLTYKISSAFW